MIRVAVLADIHGNLQALRAVLAHQKQLHVDLIVVAGDLISDCPDPNEVVSLIASLENCHVISGNREGYLAQFIATEQDRWRASQQWSSFVWTFDNLAAENRTFLTELPDTLSVELGTEILRIVHGSPSSPAEHLYPNTENLSEHLRSIAETVLICGHTHQQWHASAKNKVALNPGSVGVHFNRQRNAEYSIVEIGPNGDPISVVVTEHQVPYNIEETFSRFAESGPLEHSPVWSHTIIQSLKTGRNITVDFLRKAMEMESTRTGRNVESVSNETWRQAASVHLGIAI
jgi:putative phosphoesterase